MGHIIQLHDDPHGAAQSLLPWYVNGTLDPAEAALVEAHLEICADCRADLDADRALGREVAGLSMDVEHGWAAMRARMETTPELRSARTTASSIRFLRRPVAIGWAVAGQLAAAALIVAIALPARHAPADASYHALGTAATAEPGNLVIQFKPDVTEGAMRAAFIRAGSRVVDGPTASGAYVLRVDGNKRDTALKQLRATPGIALAEPIDRGDQP
jgi:hypothetical protein